MKSLMRTQWEFLSLDICTNFICCFLPFYFVIYLGYIFDPVSDSDTKELTDIYQGFVFQIPIWL